MLWWRRYDDIPYEEILAAWGGMRMLRNMSSEVTVCFYRGGYNNMLVAINDDIRICPTQPPEMWEDGLYVFTLPR